MHHKHPNSALRAISLGCFLILGTFVLAACSDATGLNVSKVAGNYVATGFRVSDPAGITEILDIGGELTLNLADDGSVTGHLLMPGFEIHGGDIDVNLTGTWTLEGDIVHIESPEDTFIPELPFTASGTDLRTNTELAGGRVVLIRLVKS
ncbi:MAG TPA: hypothetical protein VFK13_09405 [Gemmatimonadaceae bacterium]|nr:hypothetical protein [Gemmatimonadaceae bacterium]